MAVGRGPVYCLRRQLALLSARGAAMLDDGKGRRYRQSTRRQSGYSALDHRLETDPGGVLRQGAYLLPSIEAAVELASVVE
jgi:hypothetical protein